MADIKKYLWYNFAMGNSKVTAEKLFNACDGDIEKIYALSESELRSMDFLSPELIVALSSKDLGKVEKELYFAQNYGVNIVSIEDELYPKELKDIATKPYVLYLRGNHQNINDDIKIAIVGTRKCSKYGMEMAKKFAYELAQYGVTIISGMASGIDTAAHRGAIAGGGKTVAVLGAGVNNPYPRENKELMLAIINNGMVMSEFDFEMDPKWYNFPQRNRIISGISMGLVVAEAPLKSGSMITARLAMEQGKDVFAIPGNITNANSEGVLALIKDGAKLTTTVKDILEEYTHLYGDVFTARQFQKDTLYFDTKKDIREDDNQTIILDFLADGEKEIDTIYESIDLNPAVIGSTLVILEMGGKIEKTADNKYKLN